MNKEQFYETYCKGCGTQRCEGINTEWGAGCQYRWNLEGVDAASEIKRLNDKIMELAGKLLKAAPIVHGEWIHSTKGFDIRGDYECSICGSPSGIKHFYNGIKYKYCPDCGAKIDKGE